MHAVDSLDLEVPRLSVFGFLGPNGAGKTTMMKMLLGLIGPTSGSGSIFGLDIARDSSEVRRRVGYLPQEPRFYPHMTARETLRFAAGFFFSGPADRIEVRIDDMLELVGLQDKADRPIKTLSGGETQRLGIAQAHLLILDEPAAALDPLGRRDVLAILERFRQSSTVLYSRHILDDVQRVSDTIGRRPSSERPVAELVAGCNWAPGRASRLARSEVGRVQMPVRAVRGATCLRADDAEEMRDAVVELVLAMLERNALGTDDLISVLFTATPDLTSAFPAGAARALDIGDVPLICAQEIDVAGAMARVVRVMAHVECDLPRAKVNHVYLRGAEALRTDLAQ